MKQPYVTTQSSPMSSYPGIHTERKNSHALPTIKPKEFSGSLSFCHDPNPGLLIAVQEKSEPIKPAKDKDHKRCALRCGTWLFSIVAFCSRLTALIHCISTFGEKVFLFILGRTGPLEGFMQKVEGKLTFCQAVLQSIQKLQHYLNWICGEKPLLFLNP